MEIKINAKLEFMLLIVFLSEKKNEGSLDNTVNNYTEKLEQRFGSLRNHPAITGYPRMYDLDFCWQGLVETVLYLDDDFRLKPEAFKDEELKSMYENSLPELNAYLELVRELYDKTEFQQFITEQESVYQELINSIRSTIEEKPLNNILEAYLGVKQPKQRFVLSLLHKAFMGLTHYEDGEVETVFVISRMLLEKAMQYNYFRRNVIACFWHEFSHPVINPYTDTLFDNNHDMNDEQCTWYCKVNESIIEGICLRLMVRENVLNPENVELDITNSMRNGAPKIRECADLLLEKYENNRDKYPNIGAFYPEFLPIFGERPNK